MTFRVVLLAKAEADIEANARWWADHHSSDQAAAWFGAMHEQLKSLEHLPERNALSAENGIFPFEIRDKLLGLGYRPSYRAVFTVQGDTVYVLTVRSAAQGILQLDEIDPPPTA